MIEHRFEKAYKIGGIWQPNILTPFGWCESPPINVRKYNPDIVSKYEDINRVRYRKVE